MATIETTTASTTGPSSSPRKGVKMKNATGMTPSVVPTKGKFTGIRKGSYVSKGQGRGKQQHYSGHVGGGKQRIPRPKPRTKPGAKAQKQVSFVQKNLHKEGLIIPHVQIARIAKHIAAKVANDCPEFEKDNFMMNIKALRILEEWIQYQVVMRCYQSLVIAKTAKRSTVFASDHHTVIDILAHTSGQFHVSF